MVVADPEATLLTACANGYGKRTPFGANLVAGPEVETPLTEGDDDAPETDVAVEPADAVAEVEEGGDEGGEGPEDSENDERNSSRSYRTQRRGGKGIRDIKTTDRNGPVIGVVRILRRRSTAHDDRSRQNSTHPVRRYQHHWPQHARCAVYEPRRRRFAHSRETSA